MNNEQIKKYLSNEKTLLLYKVKQLKTGVTDSPDERIISKTEHGAVRYYRKTMDGLTYTSDLQLVSDVLQKQYNKKVIEVLEKQVRLIDRYLDNPTVEMLNAIYEGFAKSKRQFITPVKLDYSDPKLVDKWMIKNYPPNLFTYGGAEHYSQNGLKVRSKSESMIADGLDKEGVPFQYEVPLNVNGKVYYPDFRCLCLRTGETVYWEHLGKMGDPNYANEQVIKLRNYSEAGVLLGKNLIISMETGDCPLNNKDIEKIIKEYLK